MFGALSQVFSFKPRANRFVQWAASDNKKKYLVKITNTLQKFPELLDARDEVENIRFIFFPKDLLRQVELHCIGLAGRATLK